jgi:hypothetical protein
MTALNSANPRSRNQESFQELWRPAVRAGIDPRNLLIDADPTDNSKEVSGPP